jgi:uncharacterized spore protein YtfJ
MDKVVKGPGGTGGVELPQTFEEINTTMKTLIETASVDRVYGTPIEVGETKIIPAAENLIFMGFGVGAGFGSAPIKDDEGTKSNGEGIGEGGAGGGVGGGRTLSRPVAVIIASPEGVRVEPIADRTKVIMAAITAAGFVASMLFRMTRGPKSL